MNDQGKNDMMDHDERTCEYCFLEAFVDANETSANTVIEAVKEADEETLVRLDIAVLDDPDYLAAAMGYSYAFHITPGNRSTDSLISNFVASSREDDTLRHHPNAALATALKLASMFETDFPEDARELMARPWDKVMGS